MFKKIHLLFTFFVLSLLGFFLFFGQQMIKEAAEKKELQTELLQLATPHFWVISDNHFYADELFEESQRFLKFEATSIGKDIRYTSTVLKTLVQKALIEKPTGIILTGDVTLNGERESLNQMAEIFKPLKAAGIFVFAIPGNHDIYNGWARKFQNNEQITAHQVSPEAFQIAFPDGYEGSISKDKSSLSYLLDFEDYRFFMLDSNIYSDRFSKTEPVTEGKLTESTLQWLEAGLVEGQQLGKTPILFMHHNLLAHNPNVTKGFVLNNAEEALSLVKDYQVPLAMSGHIHLQDIMQDLGNPTFYEISTSAFSTAGSHIGHLKLQPKKISYEVEPFDPRPYFAEQELRNPDLKTYPTYLDEKYREIGENMATNLLAQLEIQDEIGMSKLMGEANLRYFTGNNNWSEEEKNQLYQEIAYQKLKEQAPQLWSRIERSIQDDNIPNNHRLVIELP